MAPSAASVRLYGAAKSVLWGDLEAKIGENAETGEGNNRSTPSPHRMVDTRPSSPLGCLRVDRTPYGHSGSDLPLRLGEIYPRWVIFRMPRTLRRSWAGRVWLARGGFMMTTVVKFRSRAFQNVSNFNSSVSSYFFTALQSWISFAPARTHFP